MNKNDVRQCHNIAHAHYAYIWQQLTLHQTNLHSLSIYAHSILNNSPYNIQCI